MEVQTVLLQNDNIYIYVCMHVCIWLISNQVLMSILYNFSTWKRELLVYIWHLEQFCSKYYLLFNMYLMVNDVG